MNDLPTPAIRQTIETTDGVLVAEHYSVDILGGGPAVHHPSEYRQFDGIMVPARPPGLRPQPRRLPPAGLGLGGHRHHQRHLQLGANSCVLASSLAGSFPTMS